jgi:hypothetical protein
VRGEAFHIAFVANIYIYAPWLNLKEYDLSTITTLFIPTKNEDKQNIKALFHSSQKQLAASLLDFPKSAVRGSWKRRTFVTRKRAKFTGAFLLRWRQWMHIIILY